MSIRRVFELRPSPKVSDILDLLHKVVIYTVGGPNSQTFMTKYTLGTIYFIKQRHTRYVTITHISSKSSIFETLRVNKSTNTCLIFASIEYSLNDADSV